MTWRARYLERQLLDLRDEGRLLDEPAPMLRCPLCQAEAYWRWRSTGFSIKVVCTECPLDLDAFIPLESRLLRQSIYHRQREQHHRGLANLYKSGWRYHLECEIEGARLAAELFASVGLDAHGAGAGGRGR